MGDASSAVTSSPSCIWTVALAPCTLIINRIGAVLGSDGLLMLHHSRWQCLARSYSSEIGRLIAFMMFSSSEFLKPWQRESILLRKLAGPLQALEQAMQEAEACMQDYIIPEGNHHSWLVDKALKLGMSTDVVDVHLHHFLWVWSTLYHQLLRIAHFSERNVRGMGFQVIERKNDLFDIWNKVDAKDDLHMVEDFLIKVGEKDIETRQLVDLILHKLSHVGAPHTSDVTPDSLPPNYMCIDSDQCLQRNMECIYKTNSIEIREVGWLGGHFVLKSFKGMDCNLFKREVAIQATVCHSHVVALVNHTSNPPGILMERMEGDLHHLISRSKSSGNDPPFPLLMAVDLMLQIASGMEYLHSLRIIHRDLKSRNILVSFPVNACGGDTNGSNYNSSVHLKIADFGVSKAKHDSSEYTTRDQGTTFWMAPEVYGSMEEGGGVPKKYSNKADVYSFGIVCYEILTGKEPFEGLYGVRSRVSKGERPSLEMHCPPALSIYIERCWDADPDRRPSFRHICRMLRYLKACIFLNEDEAQVDDCLLSRVIPSPVYHGRFVTSDDVHGLSGPSAISQIPLEMFFSLVEAQTPLLTTTFVRDILSYRYTESDIASMVENFFREGSVPLYG